MMVTALIMGVRYKATPGQRQDGLVRRSAALGRSRPQTTPQIHSTICAITSPNSNSAADQTRADTKLAI